MRFAPLNLVLVAGLSVAALAASLATPTLAVAGGIGVVGTGGMFSDRVYYYDADDNQYRQNQIIPTFGTGLDLVVGDRDDRIVGIARFYWQADGAERNPADSSGIPIAGSEVTAAPRDSTRNTGVFAVGLQGGLIGDPDKAMLVINGTVGSGFMTPDHTEYVFGELGVGGTVRVGNQIELFANVNAHMRFRKWLRPGATTYAGARVLFD
ncbi:MAG: hypothetical protein AB8H79_27015 [Myxococcota bacterium]